MFLPCCFHDVLRGHTDLFIPFPADCWIRAFDMDSNRKKIVITWQRTAVTPPACLQERHTGSGTPSQKNMWPIEDSHILPFSDSPGSDRLGALSLDTPKRKAEVLGASTPSSGKIKLRKHSRKNYEFFTNSKVETLL